MKDLKDKGINAFIWDFSGKFINQGINFVISIFLARLLEPRDFGLIAMVMVFVSLMHAFIDFGLGGAIIQRKDSTDEQFSTVFYLNIALGSLLTILMFFCAPLIGRYYQMPDIIPIARVMSFIFIIGSVNLVQNAQLVRVLDFAGLSKRNIFSSLISGIFGVALAFSGFGAWSLVYRTLIAWLLQTIFIWNYSAWRPTLQFNLNAIKAHWNYSYKMFLSGMLNTIYDKVDVLVIGKLFPAGQLGLYYRAQSFNQLIIRYSSDSLSKVLFPVYSRIKDDKPKVRSLVINALQVTGFIIFGMMGFFFITGKDLIVLLFGEKWLPAVPFFKIMLFYAYAYPVSSILVSILSGSGNSRAFLRLEIIKKMILTIAIPIGFFFGIEGYLWAIAGAFFLAVIVNMYFVKREIALNTILQLRLLAPYLIMSIVITLVTLWLQTIMDTTLLKDLLICGLTFTLLYLAGNRLFKTTGLQLTLSMSKTIKDKLLRR